MMADCFDNFRMMGPKFMVLECWELFSGLDLRLSSPRGTHFWWFITDLARTRGFWLWLNARLKQPLTHEITTRKED